MAWNSALIATGRRTAPRVLVLVVAGWLPTAGAIAATTNAPLRTLPELIAKLASQATQPHLRQAALGVKIVALDSGRTIFEREPSALRKPASNNKLFTGALALDRFGADFRIRTSVLAAALPDANGVVAGDVVIYGRGDFSMSSRFNNGDYSKALAPMVDAIAKAGVKRITGALIGDDSFFRTPPYGNSWTTDDLQYYYGAEVSALTLQGNVIDIVAKGGAEPGAPVQLALKPETSYLSFSNRAVTVAKGGRSAVELYRPLGQNIVYVHVKDKQGRVTDYYSKDANKDQIAKTPLHRMDCVDCHNRPTHIYVPPEVSVDRSFTAHKLDITLPYLKQQSVAALTANYATNDTAMQGIAKTIYEFYGSKYPDVAKEKEREIRAAIDEVQRIYRVSFFPEMKLDWKTHPNNIGHFYFNGCFRCHDGNHVSAEGKVVRKDCGICHTVLDQREGTASLASVPGLDFKHPVDLGDMTAVTCSDCHTGGVSP